MVKTAPGKTLKNTESESHINITDFLDDEAPKTLKLPFDVTKYDVDLIYIL